MSQTAETSVAAASPAPICIAVLVHNEERRIARCLASLPLDLPGCVVHVLVNGSSDHSAERARAAAGARPNIVVRDYREGGKARTWNRFLFDELDRFSPVHVFVDGDAEIAAGSIEALALALQSNPHANSASGLPLNGRNVAAYRRAVELEHGLFGDLYALRGAFLDRMKRRGLRLPDDLVGDDGLLCALSKTDLQDESHWDEARAVPCADAGFYCEPASLLRPASLRLQYRRMINYSVRHFQNRIISHVMQTAGPAALPNPMSELYAEWLPRFRPRRGKTWWFDRIALARMARAA